MVDSRLIENARHGLSEIVEHFGGVPEDRSQRIRFWGMVSAKLSRAIGREKAWDWRYPQQVYYGTNYPKAPFIRAVQAFGERLDGVPVSLAGTERVNVQATVGNVLPGSLVLGRTRPCERVICRVLFVSDNPRRKYCCDECRRLAAKERRNG